MKTRYPRIINRGFTIVELLVVIVVIGVLASITVVAYTGISERAKVASANSSLELLFKAIQIGRVNVNKRLIDITGYGCTNCGDQARYELSLDNLSAASGLNLAGLKKGDPWGNKYAIDENEGEGGSCASKDTMGLNTSGKSGIISPTIDFYSCPN